MIRNLPGLSSSNRQTAPSLNGFFLVRVETASFRWHPQKPFVIVRFAILEPVAYLNRSFSGRIYCSERALWKLNWFLQDFGYDSGLLSHDQIDEKALVNLRGVVRTTITRFKGGCYQNLDGFAAAGEWDTIARQTDIDGSAEQVGADDL
jgi:hypothetical protein